MIVCEQPDIIFPLCIDVFYPIVEQGAYGNVKKQWIHDRTIACSLSPAGSSVGEDVKPNVNITQEKILVGRIKTDIRFSSRDSRNSMTNIVLSNVADKHGNKMYLETSGPRNGKGTIFELATIEPFTGPFGDVEYYRVVLRRSENQAVDI